MTNLLLLTLVAASAATGLLGWVLPEGQSFPFYALHRLFGVTLVLALVWKYGIVESSLRRRLPREPRDRSIVPGIVAGLSLLGCLGLGLAWSLNVVSFDAFGGYSPLNVHVQLGLLLLPLMLWHLRRRWERRPATRDLLGRRSALQMLGLSAAALVSWRLADWAAVAGAPEGSRRPSGSKHAGSFSGNDYPVTIWLFDAVPDLDADAWQLQIGGRVAAPGNLTYADLLALPSRTVTAVLDCTGGWWSEQVWTGASIADVLAARGVDASARVVEVVSVTGHRWTFPLDELRRGGLLATHVGGELLTAGHGYPVRLVAPGRRGFQWVKWVSRIEVA